MELLNGSQPLHIYSSLHPLPILGIRTATVWNIGFIMEFYTDNAKELLFRV